MFGGLTASWARFGGVLAPLGLSWGSPGTSSKRLGDVLAASWEPKPKQSEGDTLLEPNFGSILEGSWPVLGALGAVLEGIFASPGASQACLQKKHVKHSIFDVLEMVFQ